MPRRKPAHDDGLTQEHAKAQVALLKLFKSNLTITPERFHVLMCAKYPAQMQELIEAMGIRSYPTDLIDRIDELMKEIKEGRDALHPPATKDVPCPVPAGRPEDV